MFGVLEKVSALRITIHRSAEQAGEEIAVAVFNDYKKEIDEIEEMGEPHGIEVKTKINLEHVSSIFIDAYPKVYQKRLKKLLKKTANEPMYLQKKAITIYFWQSFFAIMEVISFIQFAVSIVVSV